MPESEGVLQNICYLQSAWHLPDSACSSLLLSHLDCFQSSCKYIRPSPGSLEAVSVTLSVSGADLCRYTAGNSTVPDICRYLVLEAETANDLDSPLTNLDFEASASPEIELVSRAGNQS